MKKIFPLLLLFSMKASAQITYEATYPQVGAYFLEIAHLSSAGYKYFQNNSSSLNLYNTNHSLYISIPIPSIPTSYGHEVSWVSDELFNTNPADIEYLLTYQTAPSGVLHTSIYDQNGNLLFNRDSFVVNDYNSTGPMGIQHTGSGVKMMMRNQFNSSAAVYSLPGVLPCSMCDQGVISGIQQQPSGSTGQQQQSDPYPNPSSSTTTIPYTLPVGVSTGTMVIYDVAGREVKRYTVTNAFSSLELSVADLTDGTYSWTIEAGDVILPGRKFIIAK